MKVTVISDTIQEFNGKRYYLCGNYFQHKGKRLHIAVWEYHFGAAPKGYHVHHKTHDRSKNDIDDLALLPKGVHLRLHANTPENIELKRRHMLEVMQPKAKEWHNSEEGKTWHSDHAKSPKQRYEKKCEICGDTFTTAHLTRGRFCNEKCKAVDFRRRHPKYRDNFKR